MSESLVCIFLIDSRMVFAGVFAAFQHQRDKRQKLRIGVTGVMDMGRRLFHNISVKEQGSEGQKGREQRTQFPPRSKRARQCAPAARKLAGLLTNRSSMIVISNRYLARVRISKS